MSRFKFSRTTKRIWLFFFLVSIVLLLNFPAQGISKKIVQLIKSTARQHGAIVDIEDLTFSSINQIEFTRFSALIPAKSFPIPLALDRGIISAAILPLFSLSTELNAEVKAYDGTLFATVSSGLLSSEGRFDFSLKNLAINKHPIIAGFSVDGVLGGLYKGTVKRGEPNLRALSDAMLTIDLDKFNYSGGHRIRGLVELPPITNGSLLITLNKTRDTIWLKDFDLLSSLGEANGRGKCLVDKFGMPRDIQANFDLTLTEAGKTFLAGYLALAAGTEPTAAGTTWNIKIDGRDLTHLNAKVAAR